MSKRQSKRSTEKSTNDFPLLLIHDGSEVNCAQESLDDMLTGWWDTTVEEECDLGWELGLEDELPMAIVVDASSIDVSQMTKHSSKSKGKRKE